ncbi:MAG: hypothetical protein NTX24_05280 [Candidatus Pacearchaeota archaeon]|nr:hypothetical protein [Candidatus Pacearchaeota archaeon]
MARLKKTLLLLTVLTTIGTASRGSNLDFKLDLFPPIEGSMTSSFVVYDDSPDVKEDKSLVNPLKPYENATPTVMNVPAFRHFVGEKKAIAYNSAGRITNNFSRGVYYVGGRKFVVCE